MSKARKGLEPGSTVRVVRAGGHWSDNVGNFAVPEEGPLVVRHLAPGRYTAVGEHGEKCDFEVLAGEEETPVITRGAEREYEGVEIRDGIADEPVPGEPGAGVQTQTEVFGSGGQPMPAMLDGEVSADGYGRLGLLTSEVERNRVHAALEDDTKQARAIGKVDEERREAKVREMEGDDSAADTRAGDLSGDALKARAAELGVEGRSQMTADELRQAIASKETGVDLSDTPAPGEKVENQFGASAGGGQSAQDVETDEGGPRDKEQDKARVRAQGETSRES